jgi:hypothetical protein
LEKHTISLRKKDVGAAPRGNFCGNSIRYRVTSGGNARYARIEGAGNAEGLILLMFKSLPDNPEIKWVVNTITIDGNHPLYLKRSHRWRQ